MKKSFCARLFALLILLPSLAVCLAQEQAIIKTTHVAGSVYMLEGRGGNIGVSVGEDGILIVDNQFDNMAPQIEAALADLGKGELKFVLNTHWHGDHTGGNAHFGQKATVLAHENVRERLKNKSGTPKSALPVITFKESSSVHFNGEEIRLLHLGAGHTDGDVIIWFTDSNVIHMGDQFFNGRFPYIDLASGGRVLGYQRNVTKILNALPEGAKIIPGHGPLGDKQDLQNFSTMLMETINPVRQAISQGKTLDQIKAAGVDEKYKAWAVGFINTPRWLQIVYNSLTSER
ncbi:MBL fold metallo-hydrolase [Verrucomicrobia bacterium]|nr:MBL fold metallo-hydrolase [Verrucomicrobiota bacterium]MDB4689171.1 MBL fold metallo-hydrolase [Verrucomicrobiota bacterium]MDB4717273.1 MBL fold metallo-hydrolase [Verrucomicrobiota bacterium]